LIDGVTGDVLWSNRGGSPGVGGAVALSVLNALPKREAINGEGTAVAESQKDVEAAPAPAPGESVIEPAPVALTVGVGTQEVPAETAK
jgi:hypothetical protein